MKNFLKMFLASLLGVLAAMFLVWFISIVMMVGVVASLGSAKSAYVLKDNTVLQLDLEGSISDRESNSFLVGLFSGMSEKSYGLEELLKAINTAKENDKVLGIYIRTGDISAGYAVLEPVRKALIDFKESGKFIVAYGDYYTQSAYFVTSVADKVIMNPKGMMMLHGMSSTIPFLKGTFDKLGIKYEVFKVGTYKSAVEPYIETKMSDANREQVTSYVNSIWSHLLAGIAESRHLTVDNLNRMADEYMDCSDPEKSVEYGLVDLLMFGQDVKETIKQLAGVDEKVEIKYATVDNINAAPSSKKMKINKDKIAVLYAEGQIYSGEVKNIERMGENVITDKEYVKEIGKLKDDKNVKAVVFRINSPGGSVFASEQIWYAVTELKKEKPVIVSMGDYAASGGYYIACAADMIVAEPTTLTGSIGGFTLIADAVDLHNKIGLTFDGVKTNKYSDLDVSTLIGKVKPFSNEERSILQAYTNRFVDVFYTRCAEGRSKTKEEIAAIAQGRVWTGSQALENGLVDKIGSLDDALKIAAEYAKLTEYDLKSYPEKKDPFTQLMEEMMGGGVKASLVRSFLGDDVYRQYLLVKGKTKPMDFMQAIISYE